MKKHLCFAALGLMLMIWCFMSYSFAASIYFVPKSEPMIHNCPNIVDIMIDTEWEDIFWASTHIIYPRKDVEIIGFYLNDIFNLPMNIEITEHNGTGILKSAALSLRRNPSSYKQIGFSWLVRYATMVIKNKEHATEVPFTFLFEGPWVSTDTMDVFKLWNARDILTSASWSLFTFVDGECLSGTLMGIDQLDPDYDYRAHLAANLKALENMDKRFMFMQRLRNILAYRSYWTIALLIILLLIIMYKKWYLHLSHLAALHRNKDTNA